MRETNKHFYQRFYLLYPKLFSVLSCFHTYSITDKYCQSFSCAVSLFLYLPIVSVHFVLGETSATFNFIFSLLLLGMQKTLFPQLLSKFDPLFSRRLFRAALCFLLTNQCAVIFSQSIITS